MPVSPQPSSELAGAGLHPTGPPRTDPAPGTSTPPAPQPEMPAHLGRYRIIAKLGSGGFGAVYRGCDEELRRDVAIKVPHKERIGKPEDVEAYLAEARMLASLDHAHIVPVHDLGRTDDGLCFVVSKFIEGCDLAKKIASARPAWPEATELVATVAEALHYAHMHGLVHRDVKPGNILIDIDGKPYLADFGLALKEADYGRGGGGICGTPAYMSPEQANGEGHRVDGRSDIFSLGVVVYELLTGRRPFRGDSTQILLQIANDEPRPPRQIDDTLPRELERICLKALSKRASDRYTTAKDMAADLRHFVATSGLACPPSSPQARPLVATDEAPTPPERPSSDKEPIRIVPKGLRSFDAHDADFFLELLPGPRDRDGLPDSIRFWKTRIEETDADQTFSVGLIYGPSGCGKSSLVKAGLLPRLADGVIAVYVEATAEETETRLLNGLRKCCPAVATSGPLVHFAGQPASAAACGYGLKDTLATLRRGHGIPPGKKVLIVLDQFEQWLHAKKDQEQTELVQALRQCDGTLVQCIVMVRDDFWLAVSRFVRELEVDLIPGRNIALVDLFDLDHAGKVLAALGRAFGKLPEKPGETSAEQKDFLERAVAGLAQENKVVCVRLALFAEMMKGRAWTPAALKEVGGTEGVGATFLEETFSAPSANPRHRLHQKAARAVLKALLPQTGTDIKGNMRSHSDLLHASGCADRPKEFEELRRILDGELRLITPADPEGAEENRGDKRPRLSAEEPASEAACGYEARYYQLTHDYLVPSLRDWLTRKQKETRRGRAELLLADRAAVWNARPENRQLPSLLQWLRIRWLTQKKNWTAPQQKMMRKATRHHSVRGAATMICLALLGLLGWDIFGRMQAQHLRDNVLTAPAADVPGIVGKMGPYRHWVDPMLWDTYRQAEADQDRSKQLRASLALLPADHALAEYLYARLLQDGPDEVQMIRQVLFEHGLGRTEDWWTLLDDLDKDAGERFRAACALAKFAPEDARWEKAARGVVTTLLAQKQFEIPRWTELFKPVASHLVGPLADYVEDDRRTPAELGPAAGVYGSYAPDVAGSYDPLEEQLTRQPAAGDKVEAKVALAKRQANVGTVLLAIGHGDQVWPLLKHSPDPTRRSFLIESLAPAGVDPRVLTAQLSDEPEVSSRRAILLSLGQYGPQSNVMPELLRRYREDPDPGIHGAAAWLLRKWDSEASITEVDEQLKEPKPASRVASAPGAPRGWRVNSQGQTMVMVAPGKLSISEGKQSRELEIKQPLEIGASDVTLDQFLRFREKQEKENQKSFDQYAPRKECPVIMVSWLDAAAYCNWLSRKESLQECYDEDAKGKVTGAKQNYLHLSGYRLPTEKEWEYACRAGAQTSYGFGEPDELLGNYGWYVVNSGSKTHPVGWLKPNDLGLFDTHGNVWQWCNDLFQEGAADRVFRGGAWFSVAADCRASYRHGLEPVLRIIYLGFRLARVPSAGK